MSLIIWLVDYDKKEIRNVYTFNQYCHCFNIHLDF